MLRSIPPRTMRDICRKHSFSPSRGRSVSAAAALSKLTRSFPSEIITSYTGKIYKKPREWRYITKPFFKKIKEPIVDVFKEAEEIQVIIDLGNFTKGELNFELKNRKYLISGKHEDTEFHEEIPLPNSVDIKKIKEIFRNNILQLIIPKKKIQKTRRKNER